MNPLRIEIMDIDSKIARDNIQEVTSPFIREPSSTNLHPGGLFSEVIFGEIASPARLVTMGYIDLRTKIIHPRLFKTIMRLKGLYKEVIEGKTYAIFDKEEKDFVKAMDTDTNAKTGYSFFLKHLLDIDFRSTSSITRETKIEVLKKFKDRILISKYLVLPAGMRDINTDAANSTSEEINKLYSGLFRLTRAMPASGSDNTVYDGVRMAIQNRAIMIYEYIKNITDGKKGFFQKKYGARALALGTRNVISAADTNSVTPNHPQAIKSNETMMPLFQAMKAFQPLVTYHLRTLFLNMILEEGASQVSVIDPKTGTLSYVDISISEKDKFMTTEGLINLINSYRETSTRHDPVMIKDSTDKLYYLFQIYRDGNDAYLIRSASDLRMLLQHKGKAYNEKNLAPLTKSEMFYMATYEAIKGKHCMVTRYPITGAGSVYPSKVHLISTTNSELVTFKLAANDEVQYTYPHFPVKGSVSIDSTVLHPAQLRNLGGDFDGDTVSVSGVLSEEANDELNNYLRSPVSVVGANGTLNVGLSTDIAKLTFYNLSRIPG